MMECMKCCGEGTLWDIHCWSDGPGQVQVTCPLCKGSGEAEDQQGLIERLIKAEANYAKAQSELDSTRTHIALYMLAKAGRLNAPKGNGSPKDNPEGTGLKLAPHPSSYASTWKKYLVEDAAKAPRTRQGKLGWSAA